jgi:hypothetical protein
LKVPAPGCQIAALYGRRDIGVRRQVGALIEVFPGGELFHD